jgi:ABC-type Mn2+/Zn2+ transport system permease subunit
MFGKQCSRLPNRQSDSRLQKSKKKPTMNSYFVAAAFLAFLVGLVHSILGEVLIFRRMRRGGLIPTEGGALLRESNVRILWASWHVLTVFGWLVAAILFWLSRQSSQQSSHAFIESAIIVSMLAGSAFVLVGTKARHPGWVGLLGVAILVWMGRTG